MINKQTIDAYFRKVEDDGWKFARRGDNDDCWWYATYFGGQIKREIYLVLGTQWVYFQLPFNVIKIEPDCRNALYEYLLRLNDKIFNAKFSIDENNTIVLMAEYPIRNFDFLIFHDALKTLATTSDRYHRELDILSQDKRVAKIVSGRD